MDRNTMLRWGLIIVTLIVVYFSYMVTAPYIITIIMALILTFIFYPVYKRILIAIKRPWLASGLTLIGLIFLCIIPVTILVTQLVQQAVSTYRSFLDSNFSFGEIEALQLIPDKLMVQLESAMYGLANGVKDYVVGSAPNVLGSIADILVALFVLVFVMYYAFISGPEWYKTIKHVVPIRPDVKKRLFDDIEQVIKAVLVGQLLTAVIQGALGGLLFFIWGIPNPVFWGFVMIIFSFIPFLGTPLIFVPIGFIELAQGDYVSGIGLLATGLIILTNIDNLLRPYMVSRFATIHPLVVLIGVLGGLKALGLAGMILGPLALALLVTLVKDFSKHEHLLEPSN